MVYHKAMLLGWLLTAAPAVVLTNKKPFRPAATIASSAKTVLWRAKRGESVRLTVLGRYVKLETQAVLQADGVVGDTVGMLPRSGQKVVYAQIVAPSRAEIRL